MTGVILGFDTATAATAAAVAAGERCWEVRDDPEPGERPGHALRLLGLIEEALALAGAEWAGVERIAVGVGPGSFTGLRIGVATGRALAQSAGLPLVPVSSLAALARPALHAHAGRAVVAAIDARRGEAFAAAWTAAGAAAWPPAALAPAALGTAAAALQAAASSGPPALAVGDGALRFRPALEAAGAEVPPDESPLHRVTAAAVCRLGAAAAPAPLSTVTPDYVRAPDAQPPSKQ